MTAPTANPYPGLRPFRDEETHLFFGRDGAVSELLSRLGRARFLAVIGESGSGKSSVVRCGLLPALYGGFMGDGGSRWRLALLRPGNRPIANLARALAGDGALGAGGIADADLRAHTMEAVLRSGSAGLVQAAAQARMAEDESLLVVVDQFEELFRFRRTMEGGEEESAAFVKLLIEPLEAASGPIYILLTLRSDFIGDCARFRGLPEAINEGLYLLPRMRRPDLKESISGPALTAGAGIAPRLLQQLLNDVGDRPDQLPILQHALMRTWERWEERTAGSEPLDLVDYLAVGGWNDALDRHADSIYAELAPPLRRHVGRLFQTLTEVNPDGRTTRRPARLSELCDVSGADEAEVTTIFDAFAREGRTFLYSPDAPPGPASTIDISHESLISNWTRLQRWSWEEADWGAQYRRIADAAERLRLRETDPPKWSRDALLRGPDLAAARSWLAQAVPTKAWALRYHGGFGPAMEYVRRSDRWDRTRRAGRAAAIASVVVASLGLAAWQMQRAERAERARTLEVAAGASDPLVAALLVADQRDKSDPAPPRGAEITRATLLRAVPAASFAEAGPNLAQVGFGPDGRTVLRASADGVRLWPSDGSRMPLDWPHQDRALAVAVRDQETLAGAFADGSVRLWRPGADETVAVDPGGSWRVVTFSREAEWVARADEELVTFTALGSDGTTISFPDPGVLGVTFDPGGDLAVLWSLSDGWVALRDLRADGAQLWRADATGPRKAVFDPDGGRVAVVDSAGSVVILSAANGETLAEAQLDAGAWDVAFGPRGELLATAGEEGAVTLLRAANGVRARVMRQPGRLRTVAFSPDGTLLLSASDTDGTATLWNPANGARVAELRGFRGRIHVAFDAAGRRVVAGSAADGTRLWWTDPAHWATRLGSHASRATAALAADGTRAVSGAENGEATLWDVDAATPLATLEHGAEVFSVAYDPAGRLVATGGTDHALRLWDAATGDSVRRLEFPGPTDGPAAVMSLAFSPDGGLVAAGSSTGSAAVWDTRTGQPIGAAPPHEGRVTAIDFVGGRYLVSGTDRNVVRLWNLDGGLTDEWSLEGRLHGIDPDRTGARIAVGVDSLVVVVPVVAREGEAHIEVEDPVVLSAGEQVRDVAFDGVKTVLAALADGRIRAWNVSTAREIFVLPAASDGLQSLRPSADGSRLIAGGSDGSVVVWPNDWNRLVTTLAGSTTGCLTGGQREQYLSEPPDAASDAAARCTSERATAGGS